MNLLICILIIFKILIFFVLESLQYNGPTVNDNFIKSYPCPPQEFWCRNKNGFFNAYFCSRYGIERVYSPYADKKYHLYPFCDGDFKPFENEGKTACRAIHACISHVMGYKGLAKISDLKAKRGQFDNVLLSDCFEVMLGGIIKLYYDSKENKYIYYLLSSGYYGIVDLLHFNMDCGSGRLKVLSKKDLLQELPCVDCELWCARDARYICDYSCEKQFLTYPLCDKDFRPYDNGAEKCCNAFKKCRSETRKNWMAIALSTCVPGIDRGGAVVNTGKSMAMVDRIWSCKFAGTAYCDEFYDWCGMKCVGARLRPLSTWEKEDKDHYEYRIKLYNEAWTTKIRSFCDKNYGPSDYFFSGIARKWGDFWSDQAKRCEWVTKESNKCIEKLKYEFNCGSSGTEGGFTFTERLGCIHARQNCPDPIVDEIAICCTIHDKCYDDSKGQGYCDKKILHMLI